jgi:hypothetical protein
MRFYRIPIFTLVILVILSFGATAQTLQSSRDSAQTKSSTAQESATITSKALNEVSAEEMREQLGYTLVSVIEKCFPDFHFVDYYLIEAKEKGRIARHG